MKKPSVYHLLALGIVIAIVLIGYVAYTKFETNRREEFKRVLNPVKAKEEAESLAEIVGKIYVLPSETPKVATITNKSVLPDEPFFKNAIEGDKILAFAKAQKLILYRPAINKVVDVVGGTVETDKPSAKAVVEIKNQNATGGGTIKTQPKILFQSGQ